MKLYGTFCRKRLQKNKNETFTNTTYQWYQKRLCVVRTYLLREHRIADHVVSLNRSTFLEAGRLEKLSPEERRTNHTRGDASDDRQGDC